MNQTVIAAPVEIAEPVLPTQLPDPWAGFEMAGEATHYVCDIWVTWSPEDEKSRPAETSRHALRKVIGFRREPQPTERVRHGGELFTVSDFFHDTDQDWLQVCFRPEFFYTEAEARKRIGALAAQGWQRL